MSPTLKARISGAWEALGGEPELEPVTYTVFGSAQDGFINTPRATATGEGQYTFTAEGYVAVGQDSFNYAHEGFLAFDTSAVAGEITSVTLFLSGRENGSATDFIVEARLYDWGENLTGADWRAAADLGGLPLLATFHTGGFALNSYNEFVSETAFPANINQSGTTRLLLCSSRFRAGTAPSGNEYVHFHEADTAGESQDPKLVIEALA